MVEKAEQMIQNWAADPEKNKWKPLPAAMKWDGTLSQDKYVNIRKLKEYLQSSTLTKAWILVYNVWCYKKNKEYWQYQG